MKHPHATPTRRRLLAGAVALVAAGAWPLRCLSAASEGAFDTLDLDWTDSVRKREVPVRLYLPQATALAQGSRALAPVVVFSHGIGGSRNGYRYLGQHFAANGVASIHPSASQASRVSSTSRTRIQAGWCAVPIIGGQG